METQYPFFTFSYAAVIYILLFLEISIASNTITLNQSISDGQTLISKGQRFELGFFSPGRSKNRYLAIWYKKTPGTIVWVANKDNPIPDSDGVLISTKNGTLVLLNQTGSVIWSSNSSRAAENPVAQLLESGNLVVIDNTSTSSSSISQNYLWQSFDYLGNTLIQGMKMGLNWDTGRDQYLTSWKTTDDPSTGDSTFKLHNNGLPQMDLSVGMIKKFRTGPWNGLRFSGLPLVTFPAFSLVANEDQFYNFYHHYNDSIATRLVVNGSGLLHMYILGEKSTEWVLMYSVPNNPCDNYGQCGSNSICRLNRAPICHCLKGFVPKSQDGWDMLDWSNGCTRRTRLNCQRGEGFVKVVGINLPDFLVFSLNMSMSDSECRAECLKNCSCTAYANPNMSAGGSGCLMWFKDLIDIREMSEEDREQAIYIRLVASELDSLRRLSWKKRRMIIIMLPTISGMLVLASVLWCIVWRRRKERIGEEWELPLFDFATIAAATNNFCHTNMLGAGGFGPVHKGNLPTGQEIAVKRLSKTSGQGLEEFKNEVGLIAKLQHKNLVRLLGCCVQREERMLIYEYMANKSLDYFIFDDSSSNVLPWQKRLDIVMGIARGLLYLHQDSRLRIIHRDLKTSNILLDSNMIPKISDFGLARIFGGDQSCAITKRVIRTYGYMSPEYALDGIFSVKSDIFSFGVMLLEIVSGKKNRRFSHPDHHHNLLGHKLPEHRSAMSSVIFMLGNEGVCLPQPKQPGFFTERDSIDTNTDTYKEECQSNNVASITMLDGR